MTTALGFLNYGLVLIYGTVLSVSFVGGCKTKKQRGIVAGMCVLIILAQTACFSLFGMELTKKLYPLIAHLPLVWMLTCLFQRPLGIVVTGVMTGYFCCQLPRWVGTVFLYLFESKLSYQLSYMLALLFFLVLLRRYLVEPLYQAMLYSKRTLILFGILPFAYYLFDYATTVYSSILYEGIRMLSEFLPTIMALFYIIFLTVYHREMVKNSQLALDKVMLTTQSQQAQNEIQTLRRTQQQAATYRHDLRHHVNFLRGALEDGQVNRALDYLGQIQAGVESITPLHFCENETANLLFSAFAERAKQHGIALSVRAELPSALAIPDTELCTVLSNGMENALHAVDAVENDALRKIAVDCRIERNMLLIEITNAYVGVVLMKDGVPISPECGHGYGCRSMRAIAEKRKGFCIFRAVDGIFTLRVVLPMEN